MKTKATVTALLIMIISLQITRAQDQIFKKTNEVIHCQVEEIGIGEIKYQLSDGEEEIIFAIDKSMVEKLILENGVEIVFEDEFNNPENYLDHKKNALKIDFLSPLTGNTSLSYERSTRPGRSFEMTIGLIGMGLDPNDNNQGGVFMKAGMKFIKSPDYYLKGMRYAHVLKGSYIKPEIAFGYYKKDYKEYEFFSYKKSTRESFTSAAIFLNLGKQWIIDNSFLMDFYFGFGYGLDSGPTEGGYHYGYSMGPSQVPLAVQGGFKIGFLFK